MEEDQAAESERESGETESADRELGEPESADRQLSDRELSGRELSGRDRAVLGLERVGWPGPGAKERAIRERLGLSPTRYYQLLGALLDDPLALAHDPVTVNRLRRIREAHRAQR